MDELRAKRIPQAKGFNVIAPERRREIARAGGRAAQFAGTAHKWTPEEARAAALKSVAARAKKALATAAVLLLMAVPASAQSLGSAPYLALVAGNSADLVTTLHALHSGRGKEGNAVMAVAGTSGLIAMKTAGTVFIGFAMKKIGADGHPRVAKAIGYVAGIALAGVSYHNARIGR